VFVDATVRGFMHENKIAIAGNIGVLRMFERSLTGFVPLGQVVM